MERGSIVYYHNKHNLAKYYMVELLQDSELVPKGLKTKDNVFKVYYSGDLNFDKVYVTVKSDVIFDKIKRSGVTLSFYKSGTEVYVCDDYWGTYEECIPKSDYIGHKVRTNVMKVVNASIRAMTKDVFGTWEQQNKKDTI